MQGDKEVLEFLNEQLPAEHTRADSFDEMKVRGRLIGLIHQSPAAHLTPVRTVRSHLEETVAALTS